MTHTKPLRKCVRCDTTADTEDELLLFCKEKKGKYGRRNLCYPCNRNKETRWRAMFPERYVKKTQKYHAENVYGISLEEYHIRMSTSDCCEVCGSKERLGYDHCHETKPPNNFRGVLCNKCNRSIGQLGDSLESLEKVVAYLKASVVK